MAGEIAALIEGPVPDEVWEAVADADRAFTEELSRWDGSSDSGVRAVMAAGRTLIHTWKEALCSTSST